jgi:mannose-6-phosphate isomerase-like protein (cupin superfamily)
MERWTADGLEAERAAGRRAYLEFLRRPSMSAGLYTLAAGASDGQSPHTEDEVYLVLFGRARFASGDKTIDVAAGDTIFVPAREPHRFHDIIEELRVRVVFAPAEYSLQDG